MGQQACNEIIEAESDEAAMRAALDDMYVQAETDGAGEEYAKELRSYNMIRLRKIFKQLEKDCVRKEEYEKAAILRDKIKQKSWK